MKEGLAQMMKGGIIMDVVNAEQARIAEEAGACAVMALERVPADIRKDGGVARMADPEVVTLSLSLSLCLIFSILSLSLSVSLESEGDTGRSHHSCHGQMSNRSFRRSPDSRDSQCGFH